MNQYPIPAQTPPWWVGSILLPAVFLLLGAIIGSASTWIRDQTNNRARKRAFLKAIRSELDILVIQIGNSIIELRDSINRIQDHQYPHFVTSFFTSVYTSQLSKLEDVTDKDVLEIIRVYSHILDFNQTIAAVNQLSQQVRDFDSLHTVDTSSPLSVAVYQQSYGEAAARVSTACGTMLAGMEDVERRIQALLKRLPN
jgi:hypothetical protein